MQVNGRVRFGMVVGLVITVFMVPLGRGAVAADSSSHSPFASQRAWIAAQLPTSFEPNRGQATQGVEFVAHAGMSTAFISSASIAFRLAGGTVGLRFLGASTRARVQGSRRLPGEVNYMFGNDPRAWLTHIPTYASLTVRGVYPRIDLVYHGVGQDLEYDWVLHPGANPHAIRMQISGPTGMRIAGDGSVVMWTPIGSVVQQPPEALVAASGHRVAALYARGGASIFGLALGRYDRTKTLVIDPVVRYSSYLGGSMVDAGKGIAVDGAGNMYMTGITASADFPIKGPYQSAPSTKKGSGPTHVFVTKLNASGNAMVFSTYLGGSGFEDGYAIAQDATGVYVAGDTSSQDFPTVNAFQPKYGGGGTDAYIAKLSPSGDTLVYSSYLGGSADDAAYDMTIDGTGNAFLTGQTIKQFRSVGGNAPPPLGHTYVAKVNANGSLAYQLPIAGSFTEIGYGVTVDSQDNAYVVGSTKSPDLPSNLSPAPGLIGPTDGFVVKVDPTGKNILYSTHLGGNDLTAADAVTVDADGNAYVSGQTASSDYPVVGGFQRKFGGSGGGFFPGDAFVTKLDTYGRIIYSTFLGGSRDDEAVQIALDHTKNIYVTGWTESADFPSKNAVQPAFTGAACVSINGQLPCADAFAAEIGFDGGLVWSTYLGGSGSDFGNALAVTPSGDVYVAGTTDSLDFPTVKPIRAQNKGAGLYALDAFMVELHPGSTPISHAIVVDRVGVFRHAGTQLLQTRGIRLGQPAVVIATYHDTRGRHTAFGTLQILKSGHQVLQYSMQVGRTGGQATARSTITLKSTRNVGTLEAKVAIISNGVTAEKTIQFQVGR